MTMAAPTCSCHGPFGSLVQSCELHGQLGDDYRRMEKQIERQRAEVGRLREALEFYADEARWKQKDTTGLPPDLRKRLAKGTADAENDRGAIARSALSSSGDGADG